MTPKALKVPKSCCICKKVSRKDSTIINCHECTKSFHDVCGPMTIVQRFVKVWSVLLNWSFQRRRRGYLTGVAAEHLSPCLDACSSRCHHRGIVPAAVKRVTAVKASTNQDLSISVSNIIERRSSNDTVESNNSCNNSSNNNGNNGVSSMKAS